MRRILALSFFQRGTLFAVNLIATVILARLLTPAQVGVFSLCAAFVGIAAAIREFGLGEYLVQEHHLDRAKIKAAYAVALLVSFALGLIVFGLRDTVATFYQDRAIHDILTVLCLNFLILPFATPSMALLYREMAIGRALTIQTVGVVLQSVTSIFLAWRGLGPISLAWGSVASSVGQLILVNLLRPADLWLLPSLNGSRAVWSYGIKLTFTNALEVAAKNTHEFVIPRRFGFADLGLYSRAISLLEQFNQTFTRAIREVLRPTFAVEARTSTVAELRARYTSATSLFTSVAWPFFAFVAVAAPDIIDVLFGSQWLAAAPLLRLMCVAAFIHATYTFGGEVLLSMGHVGAKLKIFSIASPAWVVLCLIGGYFSVEAIALLSAGPALITSLLYARRLKILINFSLSDLAASTSKSAALAMLVASACWGVWIAATRGGLPPLVSLSAMVTTAAITWLLGAMLLRHAIYLELAPAFKRLAVRIATRK